MAAITKFKEAMSVVYGPLVDNVANADKWTPPERSGGHRGRYLWTDSFGIINFITLSKETKDSSYLKRAIRLTEIVHYALGRTRDGKARLPGASDQSTLVGGLRIGKEDEFGSDGDGQYHHYLTLHMFALNRLSKAINDPIYNEQAIALAKATHSKFFIDRTGTKPRMVWKISMDMSKPLVYSQGNLDPLNGYVIFRLLQADSEVKSVLQEEIADYKRVLELTGKHVVSDDTLDLGMTLWTAHWLGESDQFFANLLQQAQRQVRNLLSREYFDTPTSRRLAFRDFGTCLGIGCVKELDQELLACSDRIIETWEQHRSGTPDNLRAISEVMCAAAMIPGAFRKGYLGEENKL